MLRSNRCLQFLTIAGSVAGTPGAAVNAQALFNAVEIDSRVYEDSQLGFEDLTDDGLLISQEYNNNRRGFIQNYAFDATTGINFRFDDVVGTTPVTFPWGRVGGARLRHASDGVYSYSYPGGGYYFRPTGWIGSGQGVTTNALGANASLFNSGYFYSEDPDGTLQLNTMPAPSHASSVVDSFVIPGLDPTHRPNVDSFNANSRAAGVFVDSESMQQPFVWMPDIQGAPPGGFQTLPSLRRSIIDLVQTKQSDRGEDVAIHFFAGDISADRIAAYLWNPTQSGPNSLINLNALFGREVVEVLDINSSGMVLGLVADSNLSNMTTFLFSREDGYRALDADLISAPPSFNFETFQALALNDLGQIAGQVSYDVVLSDGTSAIRTNMVLLTPTPEPTSVVNLLSLVVVSRRRQR